MDKNEKKLRILTAKRETFFTRINQLYDLSKRAYDATNNIYDDKILSQFKVKFSCVDKTENEYLELCDSINDIQMDINDDYKPVYDSLESFNELVCNIRCFFIDHCCNVADDDTTTGAQINQSINNNIGNSNKVSPKLPCLELPTFSGDQREWPVFYELYKQCIHANVNLSDSQKVQYLVGRLKGKALTICSGIPPTGANYSHLWKTLVDKYEDQRSLAQYYFEKIMNFKPCAVDSFTQLDKFSENFSSSYEALKKLNLPDLADYIFLNLAMSKLDVETIRAFESKMSYATCSLPTFDQLDEFVRERAKILERTGPKKPQPKGTSQLQGSSPIAKPKVFHSKAGAKDECKYCHKDHLIFTCDAFKAMDPVERYNFVKKEGLCLNCLSSLHILSACRSSKNCMSCGKRHNSSLHFLPKNDKDKEVEVIAESSTLCTFHAIKPSMLDYTVLLSTVVVKAQDKFGCTQKMRFLLDSGSESNLITYKCIKRMGIPLSRVPSSVKGLASLSLTLKGTSMVTFSPHFDLSKKFYLEMSVIDKITDFLPSSAADVTAMKFLDGLCLADDKFYCPAGIDGILGADVLSEVIGSRKISQAGQSYSAIETSLGFVVIGRAPLKPPNVARTLCVVAEPPLEKLVERFWETEDLKGEIPPDSESFVCETLFHSSVRRTGDGSYSVSLPFKEDPSCLGDSYNSAKRRLLALERKLNADPSLRLEYNKLMEKHLELGYIKEVNADCRDGYFIPHHGVVKESSTTPLRIVYDASAKSSSSKSLNDLLYAGPKLQADILLVLLHFRIFPVALTADIRQMYLRIRLNEEHRKFQRLLFRFDSSHPIKIYEMQTLAFVVSPSPYLAIRTIKQLISDEQNRFPVACETASRDFFVDDYVSSCEDENVAKTISSELISLFKTANFDLVKWSSNSQEVLEHIPPECRLNEVVTFNPEPLLKVLSMQWNPAKDEFSFSVAPPATLECSKRIILSTVARIYDPLGFLAPVTMYLKLMIKQLWLLNVDWDDMPPDDVVNQWKLFLGEFPCLEKVSIPRSFNYSVDANTVIVGFCDASEKAYGAVVYIRTRFSESEFRTQLVISKSKVAPVKGVMSIPRLELCSAVLLSKLLKFVIDGLSSRVTFQKVYALSDSTVALHWIVSSPHQWKTFEANRVSKIQENLPVDSWYHVRTHDNSADCLSRSLTPKQLLNNNLWPNGPKWMDDPESTWPIAKVQTSLLPETEKEVKKGFVLIVQQNTDPLSRLVSRCSNWLKIRRTVVYVLRFCNILRNSRMAITATDLSVAEMYLFKNVQKNYFNREIEAVENNQLVSPALRRLSPFLDNGMLRVGGRLRNASMEFTSMHPLLLPKGDQLIDVLIVYWHEKHLHAGPEYLMSLLRQKYWILSARGTIRRIIRNCNKCFRMNPQSTHPIMADLPSTRVQYSSAFLHSGVDYCGPFQISLKRGRGCRTQKAYICLFVCFASKAVHLELASELTTTCFIAALKRFLSRRGTCASITSDHGTNFVGAKSYLNEVDSLLASEDYVKSFGSELAHNAIQWKFIPESTPHMGGLWESNIKSVKSFLYKTIGAQILSYEEFVTVLTQIECVVNSRPLTFMSQDPAEPRALTPAHFLTAKPLEYIPAEMLSNVNVNRLSRPQLLDSIVQSFWKRWHTDYLHTLQVRQKWNTPSFPVRVGLVVLIMDNRCPPLKWPMGVIEEVYPGNDGIIRVVLVRTAKSTYTRPVVKLCPLPTQ